MYSTITSSLNVLPVLYFKIHSLGRFIIRQISFSIGIIKKIGSLRPLVVKLNAADNLVLRTRLDH
jgi:hypothetical protein